MKKFQINRRGLNRQRLSKEKTNAIAADQFLVLLEFIELKQNFYTLNKQSGTVR